MNLQQNYNERLQYLIRQSNYLTKEVHDMNQELLSLSKENTIYQNIIKYHDLKQKLKGLAIAMTLCYILLIPISPFIAGGISITLLGTTKFVLDKYRMCKKLLIQNAVDLKSIMKEEATENLKNNQEIYKGLKPLCIEKQDNLEKVNSEKEKLIECQKHFNKVEIPDLTEQRTIFDNEALMLDKFLEEKIEYFENKIPSPVLVKKSVKTKDFFYRC
ncbi:MAG: hypothetical protein PUB18_03060 [bacterium]|nr:hypothetical protein [bacterium]